MSNPRPFIVDPVLTGIVIAYKNGKLIADDVLPRLEPRLPKSEFKWWKFSFDQSITRPDTKVGRKSAPNQVEFGATEDTASTEDYGLDDMVPNDDIANAPAGYDPRQFAAQNLMDLILLDREIRVANKVMDANNYAATNKEALAGADKWSDAASKPIVTIAEACDSMPIRANMMAIGRVEWTVLRTNPSVLRALTPSGAADGYANKRAVADLLELDDILVGEAFVNVAKPGQAPVRARVWGNHALLFHRAPLATSLQPSATFGWTAQFGQRVSGTIDKPEVGLRGSQLVRSGESVKEVIAAPDLGYLIQNVR